MALRRAGLVVLIVAAVAVLIGLGTWQLKRQQWKNGLVAERSAQTDAEPLELSAAPLVRVSELDFRRVIVDGTPRFVDALFIANQALSGARGEDIVVPVAPVAGGTMILVDLGWIPDGARAQVMRDLAAAAPQEFQGLARDGSGRSGHTIPNGSWNRVAPRPMGEALGYPVADWYLIAGDELKTTPSPGGPWPVSGWYRFENTTPHMQYALTWFGLAIALVVIAVARFVVAPRRARREAASRASDEGDST